MENSFLKRAPVPLINWISNGLRVVRSIILINLPRIAYLKVYHRENIRLCQALQWRHNGRDSVSNHQPHDCLLNRLFRPRSKKTSKFRVTGLRAGNSPLAGKFPDQMVSNAEMFPFDNVIMCYVFCHPGASFTNGDRLLAKPASMGGHVLVVTLTRNDISTQSPNTGLAKLPMETGKSLVSHYVM